MVVLFVLTICVFCYCSAAFLTKSIILDMVVYKYQIWDTAGQEKVYIMCIFPLLSLLSMCILVG